MNPIKKGREYVYNRRRWIVLVGILGLIIYVFIFVQFIDPTSAESSANRKADGLPALTIEQEGFVLYDSFEHVGVNKKCIDYEVNGKSIRTYQEWYDTEGNYHKGVGFCHDGNLFLKECENVTISNYGIDDYCSVG